MSSKFKVVFSFPKDTIPDDSQLGLQIKHVKSMKKGVNDDGSIDIHDITPLQFMDINEYVVNGRLPLDKDKLIDVLYALDGLGMLYFDVHSLNYEIEHFPLEYMKLAQEAEWFRFTYPKSDRLQKDDERLDIITEEIYSEFTFNRMTHMRFISHISSACNGNGNVSSINCSKSMMFQPSNITVDLVGTLYKKSQRTIIVLNHATNKHIYTERFTNIIKALTYVDDVVSKHNEYKEMKKKRDDEMEFPLLESEVLYVDHNFSNPLTILTLEEVKDTLLEVIGDDFDWSNVFMAGGSVYTIFSGYKMNINDIDLFLYSLTIEEANDKVNYILQYFSPQCYVRTADSISFNVKSIYANRTYTKIQIILRLYKSKSEILYGFDVDCCSIGFNGKDIYITPLCRWSIKNMVLVVNLKRASPTYELRLVKYAQRGLALLVPALDPSLININDKVIKGVLHNIRPNNYLVYIPCNNNKDIRSVNPQTYFSKILSKLHGLSYILVMLKIKLYKKLSNKSDYAQVKSIITYPSFPNESKDISLSEKENKFRQKYRGWQIQNPNYSEMQKFTCIKGFFNTILPIPTELYNKYNFTIPQYIEWKTQNPGEQLTSTIHKIIINNPKEWYNGPHYISNIPSPLKEFLRNIKIGESIHKKSNIYRNHWEYLNMPNIAHLFIE